MKLRLTILLLSHLLFGLAATAAGTGQAAPTVRDTLPALQEHQYLWGDILWGKSKNPALMQRRYRSSHSEIALGINHSKSNRAAILQLGDGHTLGQVEASSYLHLNPRNTVWGEASYRTGTRRHIVWNSTADYLLLYPHVMADTLGGNLTNERYTFTGGWAGRTGRRTTIGAEMRFRAEHEYRTYDPRPRSIVTDMTIQLGAAYDLRKYTAAANAGLRFYKQTNSVSFFREAGVIPEYQMVGLGMDYKRFSGSNASSYYKATGMVAGLDFRPSGETGLFLSARYDFTPYKRILPRYNALPLTTLYVQQIEAEGGWKQQKGRWGYSLTADISHERRTGDEHIAGNSSGSEYRIVDVLTMYHSSLTIYRINAALTHTTRQDSWTAWVRGGYAHSASRYETPARRMNWRKAFAEVQGQWMHRFKGGSLLACRVNAAACHNLDRDILMPYASMDKASTALVDHTYASLTANYYTAGAEMRIDIPLPTKKRYALFALAGGSYTQDNGSYHRYVTHAAVGLTF